MQPPTLLGQSEHFLEVLDQVSLYAGVNRPVLIIGERGTGKELIAARLHYLSERWDRTYLTLNCATLSPQLIESELFGHEAGAFTGASKSRQGRFEQANHGSLFLDELANLPMAAQEKLLRTLEYGQFERVGSNHTINVNVRLIAATNIDLPHAASQGKFRQDLLDRLSFAVITLPPLRHRQSDIILLAEHFASHLADEIGLAEQPSFSAPVKEQLKQYHWPGNIRQLKNVVERAVVEACGAKGQIESICLDPFDSPWRPGPATSQSGEQNEGKRLPVAQLEGQFSQLVSHYEKQLIRQALEHHQYNQRKCAAFLGLSYDQLRGLLKKYPNLRLPTAGKA